MEWFGKVPSAGPLLTDMCTQHVFRAEHRSITDMGIKKEATAEVGKNRDED
jgi:hypothetical protein